MSDKPFPLAAYKWRNAEGEELWVMGLFKDDGSHEWGIQAVSGGHRVTISGLRSEIFDEIQSAVARAVTLRTRKPDTETPG